MNKSDLILEFIDGTLDAGREQRLFEQMAGHPELRAELRQYVMIGDAVRADREAYMPPADVERRLLGGLGVLPFLRAQAQRVLLLQVRLPVQGPPVEPVRRLRLPSLQN